MTCTKWLYSSYCAVGNVTVKFGNSAGVIVYKDVDCSCRMHESYPVTSRSAELYTAEYGFTSSGTVTVEASDTTLRRFMLDSPDNIFKMDIRSFKYYVSTKNDF